MNRETAQARIDEIRWYHEIDFGDGLRSVSGAEPVEAEAHRVIWRFIENLLDQVDFRGKTVLDVGCWDGYWSFYAERSGARSVLALDDFTQNWSNSRGIYLAKELLASEVEIVPDRSIHDLALLGRRFDVVLCLGLFYHLWDPFHGFAQIRHCAHDDSLVVLEGVITTALPPRASFLTCLAPCSKFVPSRDALLELLHATYLRPIQFIPIEPLGEADEPESWGRLPPDATCRVVVGCAPMNEQNDAHMYKPPFGLHVYDPRFRDDPA